jgi:hypothetical protein
VDGTDGKASYVVGWTASLDADSALFAFTFVSDYLLAAAVVALV